MRLPLTKFLKTETIAENFAHDSHSKHVVVYDREKIPYYL